MSKSPMTIVEAIKLVMRESGKPLTAREAYNLIVARSLYPFQAKDPKHIVLMQIRRHCAGIDFPSASATKHFEIVGNNTYIPLSNPTVSTCKAEPLQHKNHNDGLASEKNPLLDAEIDLWNKHLNYISLFKEHMLIQLKELSPLEFEHFARELMLAYGFEDVEVTNISKDGGIDGYGKLRVGLAHLNVAFQCKRWKKNTVHRDEIDKFRGATQGKFEQGIFFTTSNFSSGAISASIQSGAIPIVLLDGDSIINLMITNKFRVEASQMEIPTFAL
ncbi:restriction endonuclease [Chromobacterium subtsugae]|uniref:Restriction endonuclease n=2 Tax=Chromobacterium subtsugae TaxID=251747 RepID=A0ABS7F8K1_9NEIS|nr:MULTISPECIES: restriction endonuclease [Chromobacterium]MBW8286297.1 restriction endonuclease [Chromobacterium subtsugae]WSE91655.1 restriction endonuclease [Chromobacterium subtsugae]WVH60030.1 restriction endonuclease [Chromobacterium subtsugae]